MSQPYYNQQPAGEQYYGAPQGGQQGYYQPA